jgi:hypothetical protein
MSFQFNYDKQIKKTQQKSAFSRANKIDQINFKISEIYNCLIHESVILYCFSLCHNHLL